MPDDGSMDAAVAAVVLHVPPLAISCRVTVAPTHTVSVPVTGLMEGSVSTLIVAVAVSFPQLVVVAM